MRILSICTGGIDSGAVTDALVAGVKSFSVVRGCKHRVAVENQEAVMQAATDGLNGAYPAEKARVAADSGDEGGESDAGETDTDGYERPARSEHADFGGGESTGIDEL